MNATKRATSVSAALRHVRDAEHLLVDGDHRSVDQAYHLAGFGPECARKACLGIRWADKALGHNSAEEDARLVLEVLLAVDAHAHRYRIGGGQWGESPYPALGRWGPESRYVATGTHEPAEARALVAECREIVDRITTALWADGLLEEIS
ncbi:MAG: hypothetical protein AAGF11_28850 [Myxococcota bacterium]